MPGSLNFEFSFSKLKQEPISHSDQPMRILILGDFSGRGQRGQEEASTLSTRQIRNIDIDNFEQTMSRMAIAIRVCISGVKTDIAVREMEDFHPDHLYQSLDIFKTMEASRNDTAASDTAFSDLLGGQVKQAPDKTQPASVMQSAVNNLIKNIVGNIPIAPPSRDEHIAAVDAASAEVMRTLLHEPAFTAIEAAWHSLHLLVTSLELDDNLQLHILDVSKQEFHVDLTTTGEKLDSTALYQLLVEQTQQSPDSAPWSVIIGNYTFDSSEDDIAMLAAIGAISEQAGAPFIAAASPRLLGCDTLAGHADPDTWFPLEDVNAERWQALRSSTYARWIGLASPRLLLRQPYGKNSNPIEQFIFEEMPGLPLHEGYLWGNPAFGCALLLGGAYAENGWEMNPGDSLDIDDLPAYTWRHEEEAQMQACAEVYLPERAGDSMLAQGLMPFLSFKNRNAVRLMRSQSIAHPSQALSGPWLLG